MERARNPFSPGAGLRPPALAGRQPQLDLWDSVMIRAERGRADRGIILHGLRGVGKTVLLSEYRQRADDRDWITGQAEAVRGEDPRVALARAFHPLLREGARLGLGKQLRRAAGIFQTITVGVDTQARFSLGLTLQPPGDTGTGNLDLDVVDLVTEVAQVARRRRVGAMVAIDEMQDLDRQTLSALCTAAHHAGQRSLPFFLLGAGLPALPGALATARSYAERLYSYQSIDRLDTTASRQALTEPAEQEGVAWDGPALDLITAAADGYPYFLQAYGQATWVAARASPISAHDAEVGIQLGTAELDAGFFRSRWDRATPAERGYLQAMAHDGAGPSRTGDIADRMNRSIASLGPTRAGLINKGLVYAPEHGHIGHTIPGMTDFIRRQTH